MSGIVLVLAMGMRCSRAAAALFEFSVWSSMFWNLGPPASSTPCCMMNVWVTLQTGPCLSVTFFSERGLLITPAAVSFVVLA